MGCLFSKLSRRSSEDHIAETPKQYSWLVGPSIVYAPLGLGFRVRIRVRSVISVSFSYSYS